MSDSKSVSSMSEQQIKKTEDWRYLVSVGHESTSYEGFYAVASSVRNRVQQQNKSYRQIVTAANQYQGYSSANIGKPINNDVDRAAMDILKGGASSVKDYTMFFGRIGKNDIWYEADKCGSNIPIIAAPSDNLHNVFYKSFGSVHNAKKTKTKDAVILYDGVTGKWNFAGTKYTPSGSSKSDSSTKAPSGHFTKGTPEASAVIEWNKNQNYTTDYIKKVQIAVGVKDDGDIGINTVNAIYSYQTKYGLTKDGKWGSGCATYSKLTREYNKTATTNNKSTTQTNNVVSGKGINPKPLFQKQTDYKSSPYVSKADYLSMSRIMNGAAYSTWDINSDKLKKAYATARTNNGGATTISSSGCGVTSFANLKGMNPKDSAELSMKGNHRVYGKGTAAAFFSSQGGSSAGNAQNALNQVANGKYLICSMRYGNWCGSKNGGHFILVYGYDGANVYVSDPNSYKPERAKAAKNLFNASYNYGYLF